MEKITASSVRAMEGFIFWSRWLQAPLYLGLIVAQGVYVYQFMHELAILVTKAGSHVYINAGVAGSTGKGWMR